MSDLPYSESRKLIEKSFKGNGAWLQLWSLEIDYEHAISYEDIIEGKLDKDDLAIVKDTHYRVILSTLTTEQLLRNNNTGIDYRLCVSINVSALQLMLIIYRH